MDIMWLINLDRAIVTEGEGGDVEAVLFQLTSRSGKRVERFRMRKAWLFCYAASLEVLA
jgi:hypothetical protein